VRRNSGGFGNHRAGCPCAFCKRAAKLVSGELKPPAQQFRKKNSPKLAKQKAARDRAAKIRGARLNSAGRSKRTGSANASFYSGAANRSSRAPRGKSNTRRNSSDGEQAVKLFESFHGRDAQEVLEKQRSAAMRLDYTALGDLDYIKVRTPLDQVATFNFEGDKVKLASSPDGKQLYLIGGNQNLASCLDAESLQKDLIDLGDAIEVQYRARKIHSNFEVTSYYHKFGEDTGAVPRLLYDKLKREVFFAGGEYFIDTKQGVSPGIEN
jgi:hypothetical protein